jgi:hypothetical protein
MNTDIVSEMVGQMRLTPAMADELQRQQTGGGGGYSGGGGGGGYASQPGFPENPEEQMRLMEQAQIGTMPQQQQQQPPMQEYEEISEVTSNSTESELDLEKIGLVGKPKSMMDTIMDYLKDPLIVIVLYVILSLVQVDKLVKQVLPAMISGNTYYYLAVKGLLMGTLFLGTRLVFT